MAPSSPDPNLKKKTSFRDRLKWPAGKAAPTSPQPPQQEEAPKKRSAYRPKHAASDFSRLAAPVVPRRVTSLAIDQPALPGPSSPVPDKAGRRDRPSSRTERSLERERERSSNVDAGTSPRNQDQAPPTSPRIQKRSSLTNLRAARASDELHPVRTRSSAGGRSHSSGGDATLASARAALRIPINTAPIVWNLDLEGIDVEPPSHPEQRQPTKPKDRELSPAAPKPTPVSPKQHPTSPPNSTPTTAPTTPSDFELFLARAEAQDRQQREDVWKTITAARASAAATGGPPPIIRPSPHAQFASNKVGGPSRSRDRDRDRDHSLSHRRSTQHILSGVSASAQEQAPLPGGATYALSPKTSRQGLKYGLSPKTSRKALNGKVSMGSMGGYVSAAENGERERTLRRETSIAQKIVEYIRPPRESGGFLYHSGSRTSMRRAGAWGGEDNF
ncbi:hypothetical protein B0T14DRAFT_567513 [Immersiella caudata]|uniref:Uncharacterized protein n=1 Tax=Immersiella caudata TaxID=314043 RepID=A0AA39WSR3_9PEZI|nr:hypothetical protein B0T14DRAFT_567513 [Immersiella caudata]